MPRVILVNWLIPEHQSVNPSRERIVTVSGKYKRLTFVFSVFQALFLKCAIYLQFSNPKSKIEMGLILTLFHMEGRAIPSTEFLGPHNFCF